MKSTIRRSQRYFCPRTSCCCQRAFQQVVLCLLVCCSVCNAHYPLPRGHMTAQVTVVKMCSHCADFKAECACTKSEAQSTRFPRAENDGGRRVPEAEEAPGTGEVQGVYMTYMIGTEITRNINFICLLTLSFLATREATFKFRMQLPLHISPKELPVCTPVERVHGERSGSVLPLAFVRVGIGPVWAEMKSSVVSVCASRALLYLEQNTPHKLLKFVSHDRCCAHHLLFDTN